MVPEDGVQTVTRKAEASLSPLKSAEDEQASGCDLCTRGTNSTKKKKRVTVQLAEIESEILLHVPLMGLSGKKHQWQKTSRPRRPI